MWFLRISAVYSPRVCKFVKLPSNYVKNCSSNWEAVVITSKGAMKELNRKVSEITIYICLIREVKLRFPSFSIYQFIFQNNEWGREVQHFMVSEKEDKGADADLTLKFWWPYDTYHIIFLAICIPSFRAQTVLHMEWVASLVDSGRHYRHIRDSLSS